MKKFVITLLLIIVPLCGCLYAQTPGSRTVKGTVVDDMNIPVAGAFVLVKGSTRGVSTDLDGKFTIEVTPDDILQFQFLGLEDQDVKVGNSTTLKVKMESKQNALDEVTVVAYGTQRKASVIGAITTVSTDELKMPVANLSSGLAGKLAGLVVLQRTSEPGSGADFWIRGMNTFGSNNRPLVLVDGVERSMDLVDVEDIASFSILKDATATALYGVRGANGIVIITTKRGIESKPKVSFKAELGTTSPVRVPQMANTEQWIDFYNELFHDQGADPAISDWEKQMYLSGVDPDLYPSVDWMKTIFKNSAFTNKYNLSVTGGSQRFRYYVGGSYYGESGILNVANNERYDSQMRFDRFNFRSNVDINITPSTVLGLSLSTQFTIRNTPGTNDVSDIYAYTMQMTPIATPPIFSDGRFARTVLGRNPYNDVNNMGYKRNNAITAQSLLSLTQHFDDFAPWLEGFSLNAKISWDADNSSWMRRYVDPTLWYVENKATGRDPVTGALNLTASYNGTEYMSLVTSTSSYTIINAEASALYERLFNSAHRVSAMFLFNMRNYQNNTTSSYQEAFPYRNIGIAGRATYSYKDRYFGEFNFGYNGSENFAPGHKFGFFPSFAVGYLISNESFWAGLRDVVSSLKFKASYGKIGNDQIGGGRRFAFNSTMNTGASGFRFGTGDGTYVGGITTGETGNEDVAWEEAQKFNAGFESEFFHSLRVVVDYFRDDRNGIFIRRESMPSVVGANVQQYVNIGRMINQGIDVSVEYDHTFPGGFYASARANYTYNRNLKVYDDKAPQIWPYQNTAGYSYLQQMGLVAEGLFKDYADIASWPHQDFGDVRPGDIKYRDINGDGVVNTYDMIPIGYTTIPEINYGFGVSLSYKGFDASIFFSGVDHVTRIIGGNNLSGASYEIPQLGQIYADVAENRWTLSREEAGIDQSGATYPRLSMNKVENNEQPSTFWQRDMSFLRLKNAEIGYTLPKKLTKKAGLETVRFYVAGVNLLTFSAFKLWDPELNVSYGNAYPQMKSFNFGLNLNF